MEFMPMRTLSREPQAVINNLRRDGELVMTNNGQPIILMIDLVGRDLVETVNLLRRNNTKDTSIKALAKNQLNARGTSEEKRAAMRKIRALLADVDGNSIDLDKERAERRAAKYERFD